MKTLRRAIFVCVGVFLLISILVQASFFITRPDLRKMPTLKDGDIVFQTSDSNQSLAIILASKSLYSHVGLVRFDANKSPIVIEAAHIVKETPLHEWMARGIGQRVLIKRIPDLTERQLQGALSWAKRQEGKPYDFYFLPSYDAFYCSELTQGAFEEGSSITLGKMEVIGNLHLDSRPVRALIEKRWKNYPPCRDTKISDFDSCLDVIKKQTLITPASIAADARLNTVYSNYGIFE